MKINEEHSTFKLNGEKNYAYETGKLQAMLLELARRVENENYAYTPENYVEQLKEEGILE